MPNLPPWSKAAVTLLLVASGAYADISPTQFVGSGISAKSDASVTMEKAKVEIVWGTPCALSATFTMVNSSSEPKALTVGFPMYFNEEAPATKALDPLSLSFDGEAGMVSPPSKGSEERDIRRDWLWYYCKHTFKPGKTEVAVKTILRASLVYSTPFHESLHYCIETGRNWAGNIGEEEVTIRFPDPPRQEQITRALPATYEIDGNCVRWRFVNFKPTGQEFDIALTYVRPDVMRAVIALRDSARKNPDASATAIRLAKHVLMLGSAKSNSGFPPSLLGTEQYDALLARIAATRERKVFVDHYRPHAEGGYRAVSSAWTPGRLDLIQVLAEAGYRDEASQRGFITEGEKLLKDLLARDPHDAEAWNVYLANYWRFSFAAVGHWFGATRLSRAQAKLIETAAENCPADETIRLWLALRHGDPGKRDPEALFKAIRERGFMKVDYPVIDYGYR